MKAARVSPEAWAQLLVPLAYARHLYARGWKRQCGTYESASRWVFKGRAGVVRVVTRESVPEILEDPVVKCAGHWVLSASVLLSKCLRECGWGEVWPTYLFSLGRATTIAVEQW
jgi:hypothetical protein